MGTDKQLKKLFSIKYYLFIKNSIIKYFYQRTIFL